ncbi:MAG: cytochrome b/b6 domain-containing protein [Sphingomonadales bacterium]|nr:cytochrome b/b6 domain-containing protein [Sphingomonadales bacterium]
MTAKHGIRVWDGPTRLFHWLLVGLFAICWWTARNDEMAPHLISGMLLLALLVFRLIWGLIGGSTARFHHFLAPPRAVLAYLGGRGKPARAGHNPLGGYSVVAILGLLALQVASGTVAVDVDGIESGPLSAFVSFDHGRLAAAAHHQLFNLLLVLIALHIAAILFYLARGRDLLSPMITGRDRQLPPDSAALASVPRWRFVLAAVLAGGLGWWIGHGLRF